MNDGAASPWPVTAAWIQSTVVNAAPTITTNMTGLRIMRAGFNLANESTTARTTRVRSKRGLD
jgi:hypothetical protein